MKSSRVQSEFAPTTDEMVNDHFGAHKGRVIDVSEEVGGRTRVCLNGDR